MNRKELLSILGENLRKYREMNKLTQEELAEKAGISYPFYANLERSGKGLSVTTLKSLADALGVSTDSLLQKESSDTELDNLISFLKGKPKKFIIAMDRMIRILYENNLIS